MDTAEFFDKYLWLIVAVGVWELAWKGIALWKAARSSSKAWFITLLIINSSGVLPILYIFVFSKQTKS